MPRTSTLITALFFSCSLAVGLIAAEPQPPFDFGLDLTVEGSAGVTGGFERGQALHGLALLHGSWKPAGKTGEGAGLTGYASLLGLAGQGPTRRYLGDFLAASNIEGYESFRLYSWWLQAAGQDWSLRAGALLADEEFTGTAVGGNFFNSAFGWPAFISANIVNTGPAFFVAAPGLRLEKTWGETAAWRLGIYDGDTFDSPTGDPTVNRYGLHYQVGGAQGWFLISEAAFTPAGGSTRLKVGAWLHTADFADVRDDASGQPFAVSGRDPRNHSSNHGLYAIVEHTLSGESGQAGHLEVYARVGGAPGDRNAISWAVDTGLGWTGPMTWSPLDWPMRTSARLSPGTPGWRIRPAPRPTSSRPSSLPMRSSCPIASSSSPTCNTSAIPAAALPSATRWRSWSG